MKNTPKIPASVQIAASLTVSNAAKNPAAVALGRLGGLAKSPAKARSSAENAAKARATVERNRALKRENAPVVS